MKRFMAVYLVAVALAGCGQLSPGPTPTPTITAVPTVMTVVIACEPCGSDPIKLGNTPSMQDFVGSVSNGDVCTVRDIYRESGRYFYLVLCASGQTGWIDGQYLDLP